MNLWMSPAAEQLDENLINYMYGYAMPSKMLLFIVSNALSYT